MYRLPYACNWGVPDAVGVLDLLAAGLETGIGGIPHAYAQGLLAAFPERRSDVEGEWSISAGVLADFHSVYPNFRLPVHGSEVQKQLLL